MLSLNHSRISRIIVLFSLLLGLILLIPLISVNAIKASNEDGAADPPDAPRENAGCTATTYKDGGSLAPLSVANGIQCPVTTTITSSFTASNPTQFGRIIRDAGPSICSPAKSYPGGYSPGTQYYYNTHTFENSATISPACITVNFDPNSGASPCGTNAHASAYVDSYNPANQGVNYLGDVGSSLTQPFSFILPAGQNLVLQVSNTANMAICTYSFSIVDMPCQALTDLEVSKSAPAEVNMGVPMTYTVVAAHTGRGLLDATNISIIDDLPTGMKYLNSTVSAGSYDPVSGIWSIPTITFGMSESLNIRAKGVLSGTITNTAFYAFSMEPDFVALNNSTTITTTVSLNFVYLPTTMQ